MQQHAAEPISVTPPVPIGEAAPNVFEEAYLKYAPLLRKIAVRKFGIAPADAESLVHDVFATYFTQVDVVQDVRPYLIGGICYAARHHLRRTDARNALFCDEVPCAATPTDQILAEVERKILIRRVFARIGSRCRDMLRRYYLNEESTQAIARALHFTPTTVRICLSKCRKRALDAYRAMTERPQG